MRRNVLVFDIFWYSILRQGTQIQEEHDNKLKYFLEDVYSATCIQSNFVRLSVVQSRYVCMPRILLLQIRDHRNLVNLVCETICS